MGRCELVVRGAVLYVLPVLLMVVPVATASPAVVPPEPEVAEDLVGPVSEVELRETVIRGSDSDTDRSTADRRDVLRFEEGRLVRQERYEPADELLWISRREYSEEGELLDWRTVGLDDEVEWRYEYVYDSRGRLVREISYGTGGELEQILLHEYHEDELIEDVMYGPDNSIQWRRSYDYDDEENAKLWSVYHSDGTRIKQIRERVDERGRVVEEVHRDQLGTTYERIEYTYGSFDKPIVEESYDGQGELQRRTERELDTRGNVIRERLMLPDDDTEHIVSRDYEYDDFGNWIRKRSTTEVVESDSRRVVEEKILRRTIEYEQQT
ncbi:MAG: hypothetical protein ACLFPO_07755 [Spirochaetaceae bacterium]